MSGAFMDQAPQAGSPLWNRNFTFLWLGQSTSVMGSAIYRVALLLWLKEATGSMSVAGLLTMLSGLTALVMAPTGGAACDRVSRRWLLIRADLTSALVMLVPLALFFADASNRWLIVGLVATGMFCAAAKAFSRPAIGLLIPDLVAPKHLQVANSRAMLTDQAVTLLAQALAGLLFTQLGFVLLLLANSLSYAISGWFSLRIYPAGETLSKQETSFWDSVREGLAHAWQTIGPRYLLLACAVVNFFTAPLAILLLFHCEDRLGYGPKLYGLLLAVLTVGSFVGTALHGRLGNNPRTRGLILSGSLPVFGALFIGLGSLPLVGVTIALVFLIGLVASLFNMALFTTMQGYHEVRFRGRLMGALQVTANLLGPIGLGMLTAFGDLLGGNVSQLMMLSGGCITAVGLYMGTQPGFRNWLAAS